jgi:FtsP/CotA-like multicopper oxidase with cupredoxin domain
MAARGFQSPPGIPNTVTRDLMSSLPIVTWDGLKTLEFYVISDDDNPSATAGTWPGPTIRVPRGVIFHAATQGKGPPPHTIHWHGIEPTPINDGVGHCSMEVGQYTYQWQPNHIGTYFYHCHRNTVQHFEFGLYGMLLIEPPDTYFASEQNAAIPLGHCRDGKRRTAANLVAFPQFPGFNNLALEAPDPLGQFPAHPHAQTVTYDVEVLWVPDDRDSVWSDLAGPDAKATYPFHYFAGNEFNVIGVPGVNDDFHGNAGPPAPPVPPDPPEPPLLPTDFFAFNDFNADYWFVTGVPVPAARGGSATINPAAALPGGVIPPALNSGVAGTQIAINARVGQTILVRCLDAAYNCISVTFPVDVTVIAWDGRGLGVPPFAQYNHAYEVEAGTPIELSVARRFDALIRATQPINSFATVEFHDTRGQINGNGEASFEDGVLMTARIPITITPATAAERFTISGKVTNKDGAPIAGITVTMTGAATASTVSNGAGGYTFEGLTNGDYTISLAANNITFKPPDKPAVVNGADVTNIDFEIREFKMYLPRVDQNSTGQ